jgi:hypothetical protein
MDKKYQFLLPTTPAELLDRLSILLLKRQARFSQVVEDQLADIRTIVQEAAGLLSLPSLIDIGHIAKLLASAIDGGPSIAAYHTEMLAAINRQLWVTEDYLRICEANKDFGQGFVDAARNVYKLNDERNRLKKAIDAIFGLAGEQKMYATDNPGEQ